MAIEMSVQMTVAVHVLLPGRPSRRRITARKPADKCKRRFDNGDEACAEWVVLPTA
jgi:hypothetical protein